MILEFWCVRQCSPPIAAQALSHELAALGQGHAAGRTMKRLFTSRVSLSIELRLLT
jgi:hypothetical protein